MMTADEQRLVHAFVQSLAHHFRVTYGATHHSQDGIAFIDYRPSSYAADGIQLEGFVLNAAPDTVRSAVEQAEPATTILNVVHRIGDEDRFIEMVASITDQYEHLYTASVQAIELPAAHSLRVAVHEVHGAEELIRVNASLAESEQPMPAAGLDDPHIRRFYAAIAGEAVAWGQMVQGIAAGVVYIGDMFTLPAFRKQGAAASLLHHMHAEAAAANNQRAVLVPSWMALEFYEPFGYQTFIEYSVFRGH